MFELARNSTSLMGYLQSGWFRVWRFVKIYEFEPGFNLLVFLSSKFSSNISFLKGIIQFLILFPILNGLSELKISNRWFHWAIYLLIFFNMSLNLMRQSLALSFIFLAFSNLTNKKYNKVLYYSLIAFLFHYSSIIGIIILLIYYIFNKRTKIKYLRINSEIVISLRMILGILLTLILLISLLSYKSIGQFLLLFGNTQYYGYLNGDLAFSFNQILLRLPALLMLIFRFNKIKLKNDGYFWALIIIFETIISQLATLTEYTSRIVSYFSIYSIVYYPILVNSFNKRILHNFAICFVLIFSVVYWFYIFVYLQTGETVPYFSVKLFF